MISICGSGLFLETQYQPHSSKFDINWSWARAMSDTESCNDLLPNSDPLLRSLTQIKYSAMLTSMNAGGIGEKVIQRQADRIYGQVEKLILNRSNIQPDVLMEKGIKLFAEINTLEEKITKIEEEFGVWRGQGLAEYFGRAKDIPIEEPIAIDTPSFPESKVYFTSAVVHELAKDPTYGNLLISLILKGFVSAQGHDGVKYLQDTNVGDWTAIEVKSVGDSYGEYRALIAYRSGELHVFKIAPHSRTNYGLVNYLQEYLSVRKARGLE